MKIDTHVLFLIVIIGIISAGIVGATVMNNDTSMKQEVFDGITVSVPADSEFVKIDDGVYKDANNGIKINTFKNNDSMIDYLKNTKKSKIIPIKNQPPQSVAFKKGDNINILVTDGNEAISICSKDGELTSKIANSIIFSNNHKSEKPSGLSLNQPHMDVDQDFNLIMLLIGEVDTKIFNLNLLEENLVLFVDDYNEQVDEQAATSDDTVVDDDSEEYMDVNNSDDLSNILTDDEDSSSSDVSSDADDSSDNSEPTTTDVSSDADDSSDDVAQASPVDDLPNDDIMASSADSDSSSDNSASSDSSEPLSLSECEDIVKDDMEINLGPDFIIDHNEEVDNFYVFFIADIDNNIVGNYTIDPLTGEFEFYQMI